MCKSVYIFVTRLTSDEMSRNLDEICKFILELIFPHGCYNITFFLSQIQRAYVKRLEILYRYPEA